MEDVEAAVDALYRGDPGDFTARRTELVRELRSGGRRDEAREVAALRRPTLAAWAVDHLALGGGEGIDRLLDAGRRLRDAHEELLAGGDPRAVQRLADERRALIAALGEDAAAALAGRGSDPEAHRDEIEATLEAVSSDGDVAAVVRRGRLTAAAPRPAGFGGLTDVSTLPPPEPPAPATPTGKDGADQARKWRRARQEVARLEEEAVEAAVAADRAQAALDDASALVDRLEDDLARARAGVAAAKEEVRAARARAEAARREAAATAARLRRAEPTAE